ncbi:hypothetical protein B0H63DRAFT_150097 [Podospora didyma]|uniref:Small ribosomal subunit protein uS5m n=1 Tax=Podospora didyma TaxID=330526 RepID=A0AAE0NSW5_9PEZI|nr:hypothetical protein B0H63DRAFT_150097 [Podospora didyma]
MSVTRPATRSLLSGRLAVVVPIPPAPTCHRSFHSSAPLAVRSRPRFRNILAKDMGLDTPKKVESFAQKKFPKYSPAELAQLRTLYSPEQIAALQAGEAAIDPKDLTIQGRLRVDPYVLPYIDDFSDIQPIIDKRPRKNAPPDPNARFMNLDEFTLDLIQWADSDAARKGDVTGQLKKLTDFVADEYKNVAEGKWPGKVRDQAREAFMAYLQAQSGKPEKLGDGASVGGPTDADILEYILERSSMTDNGLKSNSSMAPALPNKVPGVAGLYKNAIDPEDEGLDDSGIYRELKKSTGMTVKQILGLTVKVLHVRSVVNQTRLGKIRSASVQVIAGNKDGWLGLGQSKAIELPIARQKATMMAIRNMKPIPRYEKRTVFGNLEAKVGGTIVRLNARPPGFGLRVSHRIFEMCRAAGIHDLSATMPRSRNPMNSIKATYEALLNQPNPDEIARGRGKKLVDVRKVYYGGATE